MNAPHLAYVYIVIVPPLFVSTLAWCVTGQCWKPTGVGIQIYIGTHLFFHYHARLLGVAAHVQLQTRTSPLWYGQCPQTLTRHGRLESSQPTRLGICFAAFCSPYTHRSRKQSTSPHRHWRMPHFSIWSPTSGAVRMSVTGCPWFGEWHCQTGRLHVESCAVVLSAK